MEERKQAYEWVVTMSTGDFHVLTENQYAQFKDNITGDKMFFDDFGFNPSFVTSWSKREAEETLRKYPCKECHGTKRLYDIENKVNITCTRCEGTGLNI